MTWPAVTHPARHWATLIDVLRGRSAELGDCVLYTFLADGEQDSEELTYAGLDSRARAIAARLQAEGLRDRPVLLLFPPGLDFVAAFCGCLYAGAVPVPAYPPFNERQAGRVQAIAQAAGATVVLSTTAVITSARVLRAKRRLGRLVRRLPLLRAEAGGEPEPLGAGLRWLALGDIDDALASEWRPPARTSTDVAFVQYTSGSTALPKGVKVSHANLLANLDCIARYFDLRAGSTSVSWLPPYHDMGLIGQVLEPLYWGVHTYLMSPVSFLQQPLRWLRAISRVGAEVSGGPNFAYELCARKARPEDIAALDLGSWRVAFNGAEPVRAETLDLFAGTFAPCGFRRQAFYPCYGMAEGTLILAGGDADVEPPVRAFDAGALGQRQAQPVSADDPTARRLVSCGRAAPGHTLVVVDPETGRVCAEREIGEIWAAGPSVAAGYWRAQEETRAAFGSRPEGDLPGAFLRTGDLGFLDGAELYVTGRIKDLLIVRGRNHHPEDLEHTLAHAHPDVRPGCCAAFGVDVGGEERVIVALEVRRQRSATNDELLEAVRTAVADQHGLETHAVALLRAGSIPKTSSGKVQRGATRAAYLAGGLSAVASWVRTSEPTALPARPRVSLAAAARAPESSQAVDPVATTPPTAAPFTREELGAWLAQWVASQAGIGVDEVRGERTFASFGLGSQQAVLLAGELEERLGRRVPPIIAYQYPTLDALASHLTGDGSIEPERRAQGDVIDEPIAIIGLACRFPGGADPESFWAALRAGQAAQGVLPAGRWRGGDDADPAFPAARFGAFLADVEGFDADFFGIAGREAVHMDPQQRLLLEVGWEALERAGLVPAHLAGSATGVFVGISTSDYAQLLGQRAHTVDGYSGTGTAFSIAANRLSYLLDLRGPSLAVDTACSSSLVALHLALRSLRSGECDLALAGGVNLMLAPLPALAFARAQMLSPAGRCRPFDAAADGYVRGEGCGVVALRRLSDALAAGEPVLALLRGSAVNQDGRSNGLTAPNGPAQRTVMRAALADAGCAPEEIDYVEAHGTGTPLGDPIEMDSIQAVYGGARPSDSPVVVGALKANIGHLEAAAGIAGLIKTVLALRHEVIPPTRVERLNPEINLDGASLVLPSVERAWLRRPGRARRAAVSSFGFGGTNCHVVLEEAPAIDAIHEPEDVERPLDRPLHLLGLAARDAGGLGELAARHARGLRQGGVSVGDWCHAAHTTRSAFEQRAAFVGATADELARALEQHAEGRPEAALAQGRAARAPAALAFAFTGQGSQWVGMGRELHATQPTFRRALESCAEVLSGRLERPLLSVMFGASESEGRLLQQTAYAQPALFALEWSLAELWRSWGLEPRAVIGHSVGEYVAAALAGVWSFEDGLRLVAERGRLMQALPTGTGGMLAVSGVELDEAATLASRHGVDLAADNAPGETVLSGARAGLAAAERELHARGARVEWLEVSHAFHSALMEPVLDEYERALAGVELRPARLDLVLNGTGELAAGEELTSRYWREQLRACVRFRRGAQVLRERGYGTYVELGPAPVLLGLLRRTQGEGATYLTSLRRGGAPWESLLGSLGRLWVAGASVDWSAFDGDYQRRRAELPTYPFQRQRHWFDERADGCAGLLGQPVASASAGEWIFEGSPDTGAWPLLADHRVSGTAVMPTSAFVDMAFVAGERALGDEPLALADLLILQPLVVPPSNGPRLRSSLRILEGDTAAFSVTRETADGTGEAVASARLHRCTDPPPAPAALDAWRASLDAVPRPDEFYAALHRAGLDYGPLFRGVQAAWRGADEALGRVRVAAAVETTDAHALHPALLDACFQVLALALPEPGTATLLPFAVERVVRWRRPPREVYAHARRRPDTGPDLLMGDIDVYDGAGDPVISIRGLALRQAGADQIARLHAALETARAAPRASGSSRAPVPAGAAHPLLGHSLPLLADQPGARHWQREVGTHSLPYAGLVRVEGRVALSALSYAQIALAAAAEARPDVSWRVAQVQAEAPLLVDGGAPGQIQVHFSGREGEASVRVFAAQARGGSWRLRARVRMSVPGSEVRA